ncbi:MAG TPA: hypothetical protein VFA95_00990 [Gammaproteobacteria bacterium]|nr:hypothetical protein [Gammaproteobacteria bacterium]
MTNEKQFVLGVDLDGVVADFVGDLRPIAAEWLGVKVSRLTDQVSYGFGEWALEALRRDGHRTIVVGNSSNRDLPGPQAESWDEIEALVQKEIAARDR